MLDSSNTISSLERAEDEIDPAFLAKEQPNHGAWVRTVCAVTSIVRLRLWKPLYPSLAAYARQRWSRTGSTLYSLATAGDVFEALRSELPEAEWPRGLRNCLALSKECKERGIPILEAWKTCLRASGGAGEVVSGTIPGLLDDTEEAAESSPAHSPEPETILSRLRPRKRLANPSSSSENEDALPTPSPAASNRFRTSRTAEGDRTNENEYNTPRWLANLVNRFFPLLDLDAASNPESYIRSSMTYGLQMDGSFINALRLAEWTVSHPRCAPTKASTVYINPPSVYVTQNQAADDSTKERWLIPKFVDKLLEELDSGRVDEALLLLPLDPS